MMAMVSFGDLAQSFLLKSQVSRLKSDAGRITQELASGRHGDVGAALSGDFAQLSAVSRSHDLAEGYLASAREAAFRTSAMQATLGTISENALALVPSLISAPQSADANALALFAAQGKERLNATLSAMNTAVGGRTLFGGTQVGDLAVNDADTLLAALRVELVGATTADEAMTRISAWFDAPTGYTAQMYRGGAEVGALAVSPDSRVWLGPTADDPAFREALKGFAAAALITDSALNFGGTDARNFARLAGEGLISGQDALISLAASVGTSEARIEEAITRNAAEKLTLEMAKADLVQSDPYRLASELEAVQTNLETVYAVTARLSRLTLTDFIR